MILNSNFKNNSIIYTFTIIKYICIHIYIVFINIFQYFSIFLVRMIDYYLHQDCKIYSKSFRISYLIHLNKRSYFLF
jgi:hypothetical protein